MAALAKSRVLRRLRAPHRRPTPPWPAREDVEREGGFLMTFPDEGFFGSGDEYEEYRG
jgi:hypothetical protein